MSDDSLHHIPTDCPFIFLECSEPFSKLTQREKLYAHHIAKAGFEGAKICLLQTSYESVPLFALLMRTLASRQPLEEIKQKALASGVSEDEYSQVLVYCASFFGNLGNYMSFGDTKFVPAVPADKFEAVLRACKCFDDEAERLWSICRDPIYSLDPKVKALGLGDNGVSTYFSANCDDSDAKLIQAVMDRNDIAAYNTRLIKRVEGDKVAYDILVASSDAREPVVIPKDKADGLDVRIVYGDHAPIMARIVAELEKAAENAANDTEKKMLNAYISSFKTGSIDDHKQGSRFWIQNKSPAVETYIGFIESYQDPSGSRGEWEGFAAVVNRELSAKFGKLVDGAEDIIKKLPWPAAYEKDKFLRPDFTSLEVLNFGSSGVPAGINIPNYDDIRQDEGFKNVSLANMLREYLKVPEGEHVTFLSKDDQGLYRTCVSDSFDVQVGIHELLGHGSGKLFFAREDGGFNFAKDSVLDPITNQPVGSWYNPGDTYDSKFGSISSSYEECRAECVGIYLCGLPEVHAIYGFEGQRAQDITYINWLHMARAGVLALQYYTPGKGSAGWGQAHMMARHAILKVLLEAGDGFVEIVRGEQNQKEGKGTYVKLDRSKIETVGRKAIGDFLLKLQVYKATGDIGRAKEMYEHYTNVGDDMLWLRDEVIANRKPRRVVVQHVTQQKGDMVDIMSFPASMEGMIQSMAARFPTEDPELLAEWQKHAEAMKPAVFA